MSIRIRSLASGSWANCLLVQVGDAVYLVDNGLPADRLERRLTASGVHLKDIAGIFLSHEHGDHARGVTYLAKELSVPIYTLPGTGRCVGLHRKLVPLKAGISSRVDGMLVTPVPVRHDAEEPCGFFISAVGTRLAYFVDLGTVDARVLEYMEHADVVILEANHDEVMLWQGPYPFHLKRRIASATGHLSNRQVTQALASLKRSPRIVLLGHLSQHNNKAGLVVEAVAPVAAGRGWRLTVLPRRIPGPWIAV